MATREIYWNIDYRFIIYFLSIPVVIALAYGIYQRHRRSGLRSNPTIPILYETAKIVSINPLIPQSWGIYKSGGHPQTPSRKYPALLYQQSL